MAVDAPDWLIADLHLDESRPAAIAAFTRFLASGMDGARSLYVLGDLFEAWVGDDDDRPLGGMVADALARAADRGTRLWFTHGNRDFLVGRRYAERCRMTLLGETEVHVLGGVRTLLMHGDTLCTADHAYQAFRAQSRDPRWQSAFLQQPLAARRDFALRARDESRRHQERAAPQIVDVDHDAVCAALREHGVSRLIHGHTHRPARHAFALGAHPGERIVLGDWYEQGSALRIDGASLTFVSVAP